MAMTIYTVTVTHVDWDVPEVFNFDTEEAATEAARQMRATIARLGNEDYDVSEIVGLPLLTAASIPDIIGDVSEWWG